jgi:hypothetical protein
MYEIRLKAGFAIPPAFLETFLEASFLEAFLGGPRRLYRTVTVMVFVVA